MNPNLDKHYISIAEKDSLLEFIYYRFDLDLSEYSEASVRRRITKLMNTLQLTEVDQLKRILLKHHDGKTFFINHFTVNVTEMFRDPLFYASLAENILPLIAEQDAIKIWCAGCSSGEELLSLAILLHENELLHKCEILGTDINTAMLEISRNRTYPVRNIQAAAKAYQEAGGKKSLSDYFSVQGDSAVFQRSLFENILLVERNLQFPDKNNYFDLVLCRNVMIYFKASLQNKVIENFRVSLHKNGYLALGSKESIIFYQDRHKFQEIDGENKIFQKID